MAISLTADGNLIKNTFENQFLARAGENVNHYSMRDEESYADVGYLTEADEPDAVRILVRISTITEKMQKTYPELGMTEVDDHVLYSKIGDTVKERDEIERDNGERYEVLGQLHRGKVGSVLVFNTHMLRRRRNVST